MTVEKRFMDQIAAVPVVFLFLFFSFSAQAQDACVDGLSAGVYPCENVDLYAFMGTNDLTGNNGIEYNDIWGWTDPLDGQEYVILGQTDGTTFIRITDPLNPEYLGFLPTFTTSSLWRDIKVYNNFAFIVAESPGHGMQVFDLTRLRTVTTPQTFTEDAHYGNFGNAHNIVINPDVALAYAVGSNTFNGGLHIVDISNPLNPVIAGDFGADGYTHDAQVVTYNGPDAAYVGKQIAFNSNENTLTIVDVDDPTDAQELSSLGYSNVAYAHQGWLTDDHRYFLLGDELDEANFGNNTRTIIYDVQDLDNPVVIGDFLSSTPAIDHNLYISGNLVYQSNYRAGLRILDASDVANANLSEIAFFDVYPSSDAAQFNGSWSNYPYFESGIVAVSHIEEGLFLLKPDFLEATAPTGVNCAADPLVIDLNVLQGVNGPVTLSVNGLPAGASGAFSANGVGPGAYTLTVSGLPQQSQTLELEILAVDATQTYRETLTIEITDCAGQVFGCTDPSADNFDPAATVDDGSCIFPCVNVTLEISTDCWGAEVAWQLLDDQGTIVEELAAGNLGDQETTTWNYCLPEGCYSWVITDDFGDGMFGSQYGSCDVDGDYSITDEYGNVLVQMSTPDYGSSVTEPFCVAQEIQGCTDPAACNFDADATTDDGSCQLPDGCTDSAACNFDASATCDDGSCVFGETYYTDNDGDGFGSGAAVTLCAAQPGFSLTNDDCDDFNAFVFPGAPGTGEGLDNDCSGAVDPDEELIVDCTGDYDNNGQRDISDFLILLSEFGCTQDCDAIDLNDDGLVTSSDILAFLPLFGQECP